MHVIQEPYFFKLYELVAITNFRLSLLVCNHLGVQLALFTSTQTSP